MSEYFTLEVESSDDPDVIDLITNQRLADDTEAYPDAAAGEVGSPIAQTLFHAVDGIASLKLNDDTLTVRRQPGIPWERLIDEIRDVLRDFFL